MSNTTFMFCDLSDFSRNFEVVHGPLSIAVCIFGSVGNVLNICVLTTKEMRWPTNLILTGLAVADLLVMLEYIPFTIHRYIDVESRKYISNYSYYWACFTFFHAIFSQIFHFISCCLTVILAIWRYMAVGDPSNYRAWCEYKKTFQSILLVYLFCPVVCTPLIFSLKITSYNQTCDSNGRILDRKDLLNFNGTTSKQFIYIVDYVSQDYRYISFWTYGVIIKLIPCILLTHLSRKLIVALIDTKKRRNMLMTSNMPLNGMSRNRNTGQKNAEWFKQADKTSGMLVTILVLFLITEFPQAILALLMVTKGEQFEKQCYMPLGDLMDFLALANSGINFILFCTMSRQFRMTFKELLLDPIINRIIPGSNPLNADLVGEKTQISAV